MIQRNLVGELPKTMHTPMGQIMFQFRSFVMNAWGKQLLSNLNQRDLQTGMSWMYATSLGVVAYVGQQHLNTLGAEDREEVLEERLSLKNVATGGFQRAGFASLMPMMADTANTWANPWVDEPLFAYGRTSGQLTDIITGNPSVDAVSSLRGGALGGIKAGAREDYEMSSEQVDDLYSLIPLNNTYGLRNFSNAIDNEFEFQPRNENRTFEDLFSD